MRITGTVCVIDEDHRYALFPPVTGEDQRYVPFIPVPSVRIRSTFVSTCVISGDSRYIHVHLCHR